MSEQINIEVWKESDPYEVENTANAFAAEQSIPNDADMQVNPEYIDDLAK